MSYLAWGISTLTISGLVGFLGYWLGMRIMFRVMQEKLGPVLTKLIGEGSTPALLTQIQMTAEMAKEYQDARHCPNNCGGEIAQLLMETRASVERKIKEDSNEDGNLPGT